MARAVRAKADVILRTGDLERARSAYGEAASLFLAENLRVEYVSALREEGDLASRCGDLRYAMELYTQCLAQYETQVDRRGAAAVLYRIGMLEFENNSHAAAYERLQRSMELYRNLELHPDTAVCLVCLSAAASAQGDNACGEEHFIEGLNEYRAAQGNQELCTLLAALAHPLFAGGHRPTIAQMLHITLPVFYELRQKRIASPGAPALAGKTLDWREISGRLPIRLEVAVGSDNTRLVGRSPLFLGALDLGCLAYSQQRFDLGKGFFEVALSVARERYDSRSICEALACAVSTALRYQSYWVAREYCHQLVGAAREKSDTLLCADALYYGAAMARMQGELALARRTGEEALTLYKQLGAAARGVTSLALLGRLVFDLGDYDQGAVLMRQSVEYSRNTGDAAVISDALVHLGSSLARNDPPSARVLIHEAIAISATGSGAAASAVLAMADIERYAGHKELAADLYSQCLSSRYFDGDMLGCASALEGCCLVFAQALRKEQASIWLGKAAELRKHLQAPLGDVVSRELDVAQTSIRLELGDEEFSALMARGARTPMPDLVEAVRAAVQRAPAPACLRAGNR
jgi:tetratricopeptide (TPR) repeat protein